MSLIGLCGFKGHGKNTVASILCQKYGYIEISFASKLKDIISILFGWDRTLLEGLSDFSRNWRNEIDTYWSEKLNISNFTPNYAMEYIGTELFRNHFNENIWILFLEKELMNHLKNKKNIVVTDCRFRNEYELLKKYGAKIISVHRSPPNNDFYDYKSGKLPMNYENEHSSRISWIRFDFDFEIENYGSIENLENVIVKNYDLWVV